MPVVVVVFLTLLSADGGFAQNTAKPSETSDSDLRALDDQRRDLENGIRDVQREIDRLDLTLSKINDAKASLDYWSGQGKNENPASAPEQIRAWTGTLASYPQRNQVQQELDGLTKTLTERQAKLADVEKKIETAINIEKPKQEFKKALSWVFAGLVAIVIIGFYALAFKSTDVRKNIFVGDAGLQFITLFSLVIAIILFGLTEILQGRELAALLGGISGYILGRSSRGKETTSDRSHEDGPTGPGSGPSVRENTADGEDS